jgi:hypothetical protein
MGPYMQFSSDTYEAVKFALKRVSNEALNDITRGFQLLD